MIDNKNNSVDIIYDFVWDRHRLGSCDNSDQTMNSLKRLTEKVNGFAQKLKNASGRKKLLLIERGRNGKYWGFAWMDL